MANPRLGTRLRPYSARTLSGNTHALALIVLMALSHTAQARPSGAAEAYAQARAKFFQLKASPDRQQFRHHWLRVIADFETVAKDFPNDKAAASALYTSAELWHDMYRRSRRPSDLTAAVNAYDRVTAQFPKSELADDSLFKVAEIDLHLQQKDQALAALHTIVNQYPQGDMVRRAKNLLGEYDVVAKRVEAFVAPSAAEAKETAAREPASAGPVVVLDPGHGGADGGAVGITGLKEKDVVLAISHVVADELRKDGIAVLMTRNTDQSLSLEERATIANHAHARLFVSIHANANRAASARGVQCYYLNINSDRYAMKLAAVENQTSEQQLDDFQLILADVAAKASTPASINLARALQSRLVKTVRQFDPKARDLGARAALFYVLVGARMPAVLVETSFITNALEGRLLGEPDYQRALGLAIAVGIKGELHNADESLQMRAER